MSAVTVETPRREILINAEGPVIYFARRRLSGGGTVCKSDRIDVEVAVEIAAYVPSPVGKSDESYLAHARQVWICGEA
jgi:hypothetical protein